MKNTIIIGLSLALGMALMVTTSMAWGPGLGRRLRMEEKFGCPDLPLLGEKQFHKVEAFQESFLKEIEPLQHDLLKKRAELRILGLSPSSDPAAVRAEGKGLRYLQKKAWEKAAHHRVEIWKILNPEQRAKFSVYRPGISVNSPMSGGPTSG